MKKTPDISHEYLKNILDYNPEDGIFTWKWRNDKEPHINSRWAGKIAGRKNAKKYLEIGIDFKLYQSHRLAWFWMTGKWPKEEIDHRDLDKTNNKWGNLREATHAENNRNRKMISTNTVGFKCVVKIKGKYRYHYRAKAMFNGKQVYFGSYKTAEEAYDAYVVGIKRLHGEFARAS